VASTLYTTIKQQKRVAEMARIKSTVVVRRGMCVCVCVFVIYTQTNKQTSMN